MTGAPIGSSAGIMVDVIDRSRCMQGGQSTLLAQAVTTQLAGVKRISIAALGVLLQEWEPSELQVLSWGYQH